MALPERGTHPWSLPEEESRPFIKKALEAGCKLDGPGGLPLTD